MKRIGLFILLIAFVTSLSVISVNLWSDKKEELPDAAPLVLEPNMTVMQFGEANGLGKPQLKELFGLSTPDQLDQPLESFGLSPEALEREVVKSGALQAESESKNWVKIPLKFVTWFAFLGMVFVLMRRRAINGALRKGLYFGAVTVFGIVLSADPSPMGTVKDAIHLFGATGAIFPPRMIALSIFLLIVVLANKYICAWGCQFGTLQDLIFRLNRDPKDRKGVWPQYKIPFAVTNTIRVAYLVLFTIVAFAWGMDLMELYDPFKIFKPMVLGTVGIIVIAALLVASLFVYRPWCTMFCPFGLVGWVFEKLSWHKIKVDYEACISCEACERVCPSTVMGAILKRDKKVIPDCFACGTCIPVCPTKAISFASGKRELPPEGKFDKTKAPQDAE